MESSIPSPFVRIRRAALQRILPPAIRLASPAITTAIRIGPGSRLKEWLWEHLLVPYSERYRDRPRLVRSEFGAYFLGTTRDYVFRHIAMQRVWEPNGSSWLQSVLRPGDVFVDVGANIGYYTLLGAHCVGTSGNVVALEPLGPAFAALRRNVEINRFETVRLVQQAAYDSDATLTIRYFSPHDTGGASTELAGRGEFTETIAAAPLSTILTADEIARARVIKIDVEGAEIRAVRGFAPVLERLRPDAELFVELSDETYPGVVEILAPFGFKPYALENPHALSDRDARRGRRAERLADGGPLPPTREPSSYVVFSRRDASSL